MIKRTNTKLVRAVATYFTDLGLIRASGGATEEESNYVPLANLLNAVGSTLKPKVFCVNELADQGAGHPDFGLYVTKQLKKGLPRYGQIPEHGVVEVKPPNDDAWLITTSDQVSRYWNRYRLVLVTNLRDFVLVGEDNLGQPVKLESFQLAEDVNDFNQRLDKPLAFAREVGADLAEYLVRVLSHRATLAEPKDLAWLLALYARDGLARVEAAGETPSLKAVRSALEEALGVQFEGERGMRFFHSTLVQTLFYGVFSAWVLWSKNLKADDGPLFEGGYKLARFDWRTAVWHLRAPVLRALFQQISDPGHLQPLGLVEVLDWTAAVLDRVDRVTFFSRFKEGEVVPYFYEPFLEAFDPELRKQLGVWYTPTEVVHYMVARVDKALKEDLDIPDGLAADNVYVLDPCCGTGAYLAEVLRCITANLEGQGLGALAGARVKQAATERVFGFEIMPAPFVVAHLQVGLTMQNLDASLADDDAKRIGIFLTNALTGWEPRTNKPLPFPELEEERDRAERVKQEAPILVILGNPPYNGFAGMAVDDESELLMAYRSTKSVRKPEGQGLNDLYVRFFRMAERRIAEKTGQGIVCFISNYSWLDGLSFTGMRERYLEVFDAIRIDCLNGDKYKTGKVTPDGLPDPSIFSTEGNPVGIQVGTAIATLIRKADHVPAECVWFRHMWGQAKLQELTATAEAKPRTLYEEIKPVLPLGLPYVQTSVSHGWFNWPSILDLFPVFFPGVKTSRDRLLVDIDFDQLQMRIEDYFDATLSHDEVARRYPGTMETTAQFNVRSLRDDLLKRGGPNESGFIRYAYRPFDIRWLYWEAYSNLLDRPRDDYEPHVFKGNSWLVTQQKPRREWSPPQVISNIGCLDLMDRGATCIPMWLRDNGLESEAKESRRPNLSTVAESYLKYIDAGIEDLFHCVLSVLHDPEYREANDDALRMDWPRIPLPGWPDGKADGAEAIFANLTARGRAISALFNPDASISGITQGSLHPEFATVAIPTTVDGRNMTGADFAVTVGWGRYGQGNAIMPGKGRIVERALTPSERAALGDKQPALGKTTFDIYLNSRAFWCNVPYAVWNYKLGGYQVLKKWLSYREHDVLNRALSPEEVQHFSDIARRIEAIILTSYLNTC
ncbi:MAG: N-6 DNA methylase [Candidatus Dadabacteria bacterium]|nr:N-6 DNA methylase [Candidatus Dadabacteria bacterium]